MTLLDFLNSPTARALGWTLLHALWQGFALVLPTAIALHLLQNQSSMLRYRVGTLTLLAQVLVSVVTFFRYYKPIVAMSVSGVAPTLLPSLPMRWQLVSQTLPWHQQVHQFLESHLSQFVLIYLIGVAIFGLRLAGGWFYLQRVSRAALQPATPYWANLTNQLRLALAIRPVVQVRESARIFIPMVIGVLKPVLLLPVGLVTQLSVPEIEAVLAHELAHVKRHDYAVNLLQSIIDVLYFFHPALWWLSARVREEREHCCDDLAIQACGGNGRMLAQALARVEELRLTQAGLTAAGTAPADRPEQANQPALAMAFANRRQQLLHRVRRVLGVPTRPVVSNGSLAGLTLATILLMSVSVYAIQQQNKPKPKATQPHPTRRHKVTKDTEFGMSDNQKVNYVIWKGQKLPASRVARLQRQLDQVMAGQLSLDTVSQADRDILLTIIETTNSFDGGMNGLAAGLAQIDYNNIITTAFEAANAAGTFPVVVDDVLKEVEQIDYNQVIGDAMASVAIPAVAPDSLIDPQTENFIHFQRLLRNQDSLAELQEINRGKAVLLRAQAQSQGFAVEAVERKIERLERQRSVLEQKRFFETAAQQQIILKSGVTRTDSARAVLMKQIEAGEQTIQTTESAIEKLNQQLIGVQAELEKAQKPLRETETQLRKLGHLDYQNYTRLAYPVQSGVNRELNEDLNRHLNEDLNRIELEGVRAGTRTIRPARAPRPPKPAHRVIEGTVVRPAIPAVPNARVVPVRPATPRPVPKVDPAPKPDRE